jgi:hypothetical protein
MSAESNEHAGRQSESQAGRILDIDEIAEMLQFVKDRTDAVRGDMLRLAETHGIPEGESGFIYYEMGGDEPDGRYEPTHDLTEALIEVDREKPELQIARIIFQERFLTRGRTSWYDFKSRAHYRGPKKSNQLIVSDGLLHPGEPAFYGITVVNFLDDPKMKRAKESGWFYIDDEVPEFGRTYEPRPHTGKCAAKVEPGDKSKVKMYPFGTPELPPEPTEDDVRRYEYDAQYAVDACAAMLEVVRGLPPEFAGTSRNPKN